MKRPLIFAILFSLSCIVLADSSMVKTTEALAKQGVLSAQLDLAAYYSQQHNAEQAFYWNKQAALQGYSEAAFNTAIAYDMGSGVKQDLTQAAYWYHQAALLGNGAAAYNLGILYDEGTGIGMDKVAARTWLTVALLLQHDADMTQQAIERASFLLRQSVRDSADQQAKQLLEQIQQQARAKR